jgi:hypothetical protein
VHKWTGTHADPFHLGKMGLTFYSFAHDPVTQTSQSRRFGGRLSYLACMQLRVFITNIIREKRYKTEEIWHEYAEHSGTEADFRTQNGSSTSNAIPAPSYSTQVTHHPQALPSVLEWIGNMGGRQI